MVRWAGKDRQSEQDSLPIATVTNTEDTSSHDQQQRTADHPESGAETLIEENAGTGPLFYVRCKRDNWNFTGRFMEALSELGKHQHLHAMMKKEGKAF